VNVERIKLVCRKQHVREPLERILEGLGYVIGSTGAITVFVEETRGSALLHLEHHQVEKVVVITDNPCGAYWLDVLEAQPIMGFVALGTEADIARALRAAQNNTPMHIHPPITLKLTPLERQVLRHLAFGFSNTEIAQKLQVNAQVVNNYVSTILSKVRATHPDLSIRNRTHLAFYYWGNWLILERRPEATLLRTP
jgi:DNA-binding CsgD family transcriptional regulator